MRPGSTTKAPGARAADPRTFRGRKIVAVAEEEDPIWGLFLNITATLGTRRGETCALRWEDVDLAGHRVHVRRSICKGVQGPTEIKLPKNGRERSLLVGGEFFEQIERFRRDAGWIFSGGSRAPGHERDESHGTPIGPDTGSPR